MDPSPNRELISSAIFLHVYLMLVSNTNKQESADLRQSESETKAGWLPKFSGDFLVKTYRYVDNTIFRNSRLVLSEIGHFCEPNCGKMPYLWLGKMSEWKRPGGRECPNSLVLWFAYYRHSQGNGAQPAPS